MVQNGPTDHFGRNDLIPNRILAFARPKWTKMVHFGPFRSANRTLAIPEGSTGTGGECDLSSECIRCHLIAFNQEQTFPGCICWWWRVEASLGPPWIGTGKGLRVKTQRAKTSENFSEESNLPRRFRRYPEMLEHPAKVMSSIFWETFWNIFREHFFFQEVFRSFCPLRFYPLALSDGCTKLLRQEPGLWRPATTASDAPFLLSLLSCCIELLICECFTYSWGLFT